MGAILIYHPQAAEIRDGLEARGIVAEIRLAPTYAEALAAIPAARVLFALDPELTEELIGAASPCLEWIQALTSGMDRVLPMPGLRPHVLLTSMRGVHGPQVSELAFLLMLALARRFPAMLANQRAHVWEHWQQPPLYRSTLVIVGMGLIGRDLARRAKAFDMVVHGVDDAVSELPDVDRMFRAAELHAALRTAAFVVVLVPYMPSTHHLIDAAALAALPREAFLVNVARGNVVDEAALTAALRSGTLAGAGLDVFGEEPLPASSPLWDVPNLIVTPHVGGNSTTYVQQMLETLAENTRAFLSGDIAALRNRVVRVTP